ncbi:MAG: DUF302 domain-containing protein [Chloroflexota bacterium]
MTDTDFKLKTRTNLSVTDAEAKIREALTAEGFGVLTEIDVAATLRDKLGVERPPYRILGACRPVLAHQALEVEPDVGLLLPCNVVIYADGETTVVAALDPSTIVDTTGNVALVPIVTDAKERLARVVASIPGIK